MIKSRKQRRWWNLAGVGAVIGLMSYAVFAQYVQGYEACPLCIFQRVALTALGIVMLIAGIHAAAGVSSRAYSVFGVVAAGTGAGISGWHLYLQSLPPEEVPSCGPGLSYMMDTFPVFDTIRMVFTGSGECAEINWVFLGLSMPAWVLLWFVALGGLVAVANWGRLSR